MKVTITIDCGNDAFQGSTLEFRRILTEIASFKGKKLDDLDGFRLRDINGNTVGDVSVTA